jgi:hypothetical protein
MASNPRDLWQIFQEATYAVHMKAQDGETEAQVEKVFRERQRIFDTRHEQLRHQEADEVPFLLETHRNIGVFAGGLRATAAARQEVREPHAWLLFSMPDFQKVRDIFCPLWPVC